MNPPLCYTHLYLCACIHSRVNTAHVRGDCAGAIPQYIAHKYRPASTLLVGPTEDGYADYLNWISHADATLTFPQTVVLRYTLQEPGRADNAAVDYAKWFIARLRRLDNTLVRTCMLACSVKNGDVCIYASFYYFSFF